MFCLPTGACCEPRRRRSGSTATRCRRYRSRPESTNRAKTSTSTGATLPTFRASRQRRSRRRRRRRGPSRSRRCQSAPTRSSRGRPGCRDITVRRRCQCSDVKVTLLELNAVQKKAGTSAQWSAHRLFCPPGFAVLGSSLRTSDSKLLLWNLMKPVFFFNQLFSHEIYSHFIKRN